MRRVFLVFATPIALTACAADPTPPDAQPTQIVLQANVLRVGLRAETQLVPIVLGEDGSNLTATSVISWTSSDPGIVAVSATGKLSGIALGGPVTVTAAVGELSATAQIQVVPASIEISPAITTLEVGRSVQLSAVARDGLGAAIPNVVVTLTNESPSVVSLDPATLVLTGIASGGAEIRATAAGGVAGLGVVVGVPTELDGTYVSAPGATATVLMEVTFGYVTRFTASWRPAPECSVSMDARPNMEIRSDGIMRPTGFIYNLPAGGNVSGAFSAPGVANGNVGGGQSADYGCTSLVSAGRIGLPSQSYSAFR
ncbi:MAG TPA: Ig-like domain-containing protein [Gemmatimonadaceae bacterium]|nr:Ig-like domain-containing protein [Gemmatimonadaceae bacterium]